MHSARQEAVRCKARERSDSLERIQVIATQQVTAYRRARRELLLHANAVLQSLSRGWPLVAACALP